MKNFFWFNSMLTPKVITVYYWILIALSLYFGLRYFFNAYFGFWTTVISLGIIFGGIFCARIGCELLIVLFKIHENLKRIAERGLPN